MGSSTKKRGRRPKKVVTYYGRECAHRRGPRGDEGNGGCCPRCWFGVDYVVRFVSRKPMIPSQGRGTKQQEKQNG